MSREFEEIEGKFLDINPAALDKKLKKLGAQRKYKKLFRRYVFDFPGLTLNTKNAWLRVRDEGDRVVMTYKQRQAVKQGAPDGGMREIEIEVSDFERATQILRLIGMKPKFYEENWRTLYEYDGVELCVDEWPLIPPYLEIEADSWSKVDAMAEKLSLNPSDKRVCSAMQVYESYGINENDYSVLTFNKQEKDK